MNLQIVESTMPKPPVRKLGLSDAMILIVATALPMAATRQHWDSYYDSFGPWGEDYHIHILDFLYRFRYLLYSISYFAATWSLACLIFCLRQPRPAFRLVVRRPGMTACIAVVVVLVLQLANLTVALGVRIISVGDFSEDLSTNASNASEWLDNTYELTMIPSMLSCAVTAVWVIQAMSGRWRPIPLWSDRMGRVLGFFWIATMPLTWFCRNFTD